MKLRECEMQTSAAAPEYTLEATFMTQDGRVEILRWGQGDYSAEFLDADYSVRGLLEDIIEEIRMD